MPAPLADGDRGRVAAPVDEEREGDRHGIGAPERVVGGWVVVGELVGAAGAVDTERSPADRRREPEELRQRMLAEQAPAGDLGRITGDPQDGAVGVVGGGGGEGDQLGERELVGIAQGRGGFGAGHGRASSELRRGSDG